MRSERAAAPGEPLRLCTGERNREPIFGRVTDEHGKPVRAMVDLWYHDISQPITVEERDGGPRSIPLAEQYQRTLFQTDFTTEKAWYHIGPRGLSAPGARCRASTRSTGSPAGTWARSRSSRPSPPSRLGAFH